MSHNSKPNTDLKRCNCSPENGLSLDTLVYVGKNDFQAPYLKDSDDKEKLSKRARSKYLTFSFLFKLIDLNSPLQKSYWNTYHCASYVEQKGDKLTSTYCNGRWCLTCNRIRIAKSINGYKNSLDELKNPYFVTLTNVNCGGEELRDYISLMQSMEVKCRDSIRKRNNNKRVNGIRKLECTYNAFADTYNPHFHLIIDGEKNAQMLIEYWMKQNIKNSIKIDRGAQTAVKCTEGSMMELFKYFTKLVSSKGGEKRYTTAPALDTIFQAMKRKQVYRAFGQIKKQQVSEEINELESEILTQVIADIEHDYWVWSDNDWYSMKTGENLCGYNPSEFDKKYGDLIRKK